MEFLFLPRSLRNYPGRGNTSVTAGERSRKASVTRGYEDITTLYHDRDYTSRGIARIIAQNDTHRVVLRDKPHFKVANS